MDGEIYSILFIPVTSTTIPTEHGTKVFTNNILAFQGDVSLSFLTYMIDGFENRCSAVSDNGGGT